MRVANIGDKQQLIIRPFIMDYHRHSFSADFISVHFPDTAPLTVSNVPTWFGSEQLIFVYCSVIQQLSHRINTLRFRVSHNGRLKPKADADTYVKRLNTSHNFIRTTIKTFTTRSHHKSKSNSLSAERSFHQDCKNHRWPLVAFAVKRSCHGCDAAEKCFEVRKFLIKYEFQSPWQAKWNLKC